MAVTAGRVPSTVASLDSRLHSSVYQYTPYIYLQLLTLIFRCGHLIQCEIKVLPGEDETPSPGLSLSNHDILVPCHAMPFHAKC